MGSPRRSEPAWNTISSFFSNLWNTITSSAKSQWDGLVSAVTGNPVKPTADIGAGLQSSMTQATQAVNAVPTTHVTTFTGDPSNVVTAANTGTTTIDTVKSTHGTAFTGDPRLGCRRVWRRRQRRSRRWRRRHRPVVFTADITDITAKTQTATTQIAAVAATHVTTLTGDLTGANGVTQAASTATTQINAIPATHKTTLTIDDAAALQQIQQFTAAINAIPTSHVTTLSTVQGAAGGGIIMKMAIGGVVPIANGFTPMGSDRAAIVPPNTMRLIGDRPVDDEAFIPINNSGVSQAILTETASRMGYNDAPMARGGRSWDDDGDGDDFWGWWGRHRGGGGAGGPSSSGSTLTASAAAVPDMRRMVSQYQTAGGTASISAMRAYRQRTGPPPRSPPLRPPVNIHCDTSNLGRLLFELFRGSIRSQGGNVQVVLGS